MLAGTWESPDSHSWQENFRYELACENIGAVNKCKSSEDSFTWMIVREASGELAHFLFYFILNLNRKTDHFFLWLRMWRVMHLLYLLSTSIALVWRSFFGFALNWLFHASNNFRGFGVDDAGSIFLKVESCVFRCVPLKLLVLGITNGQI